MNTNAPKLPSSPDIPLHDIKPLMEVPDNSVVWFSLTAALFVLLIAVIGYFVWRYFARKKEVDIRKTHYAFLQEITFEDPKQAAYRITEYGLTFAEDAPRLQETYENLVERLAPYKYRKTVDPIDEETIAYYRIYVEMIDV